MTNRLVIASNNRGKIAELTELLAPLGMTPIAQGELGVGEAEEPAVTFVENAILKARHAARETGLPALADDSGLAVDALEGRPGVRSARFAGDDATDQDNVDALLDAMAGVRAGQMGVGRVRMSPRELRTESAGKEPLTCLEATE